MSGTLTGILSVFDVSTGVPSGKLATFLSVPLFTFALDYVLSITYCIMEDAGRKQRVTEAQLTTKLQKNFLGR